MRPWSGTKSAPASDVLAQSYLGLALCRSPEALHSRLCCRSQSTTAKLLHSAVPSRAPLVREDALAKLIARPVWAWKVLMPWRSNMAVSTCARSRSSSTTRTLTFWFCLVKVNARPGLGTATFIWRFNNPVAHLCWETHLAINRWGWSYLSYLSAPLEPLGFPSRAYQASPGWVELHQLLQRCSTAWPEATVIAR